MLSDALEALWMSVTAPLRKLVADAMRDVLADEEAAVSPTLSWPAKDDEPVVPSPWMFEHFSHKTPQ